MKNDHGGQRVQFDPDVVCRAMEEALKITYGASFKFTLIPKDKEIEKEIPKVEP